jgi:uncharacterized membrane protein
MRLRLTLCALLILVLSVASPAANAFASSSVQPTPGTAPAPAATSGVVHAVLFWMEGCGHCEKVRTEVLPPLRAKYAAKLEIIEVEVRDSETSGRLDRVAAALGFPAGSVGVPFLVIGDKALIGSLQIPAELPALIEKYVASGGIELPNLPGLESIASVSGSSGKPAAAAAAAVKDNGFALAWIVMLLLIASLLYAAAGVVRALQHKSMPQGPVWSMYLVPALCVIGLIVAGYLSFVETTQAVAVCGPVGDCNAVQSSSYSRLFGILPVGLLGFAGYIAIMAAWLWSKLRDDVLADFAPLGVLGMALFGVALSIYLTGLELFVINAVCIWCLASATIMSLMVFVTTAPGLQRWSADN